MLFLTRITNSTAGQEGLAVRASCTATTLAAMLALACPVLTQGVPEYITYQGKLTDSAGVPLSGSYPLRFRLLDAETTPPGSQLWDSGDLIVPVSAGLFTVELGPVSQPSLGNGNVWLEVKVWDQTPLPRVKLTSAPFALRAQEAVNSWKLSGNAGTTPGTHFLGTTDSNALEFRVNNSRALRIEPFSNTYYAPNMIGGYAGNSASAGIWGATISGGGYINVAQGEMSAAGGRKARANHRGSFVWSDNRSDTYFDSDSDYQFKVRAFYGAKFEDGAGMWVEMNRDGSRPINTYTGAYLSSSGYWTNASDRASKDSFRPIDGRAILTRLAEMPITMWKYKSERPGIRHIGPTAQDFAAAFGLGSDDRAIGTIDADGVALAAIQALYAENQELRARLAAMEGVVASLAKVNGGGEQ